MAVKNYKANEVIKVFYQAIGSRTGLTVNIDVYDESDIKDVGQSTTMTEIGTTGRYYASFTPDAEGDWSVQISDSAGGKVIKHFSIGSYNVHQIGANLQSVEAKVDSLSGAVSGVDVDVSAIKSHLVEIDADVSIVKTELTGVDSQLSVVKTELTGVDSQLSAVDTELSGVDSQLSAISGRLDDLDSPPMVG